jgi:formamidopyrimidine-DNA glycosylase
MPELPDVVVYAEHLSRRLMGEELIRSLIMSPNLLRTATPKLAEAHGKTVVGVTRLGKRIVIGFEDELYFVIHLMIAGRFRWREGGVKLPGKTGSAAFEFSSGTLLITEASPKKRTSLHVIRGEENLGGLDPGGIEVLEASPEEFRRALQSENHTLKRALTDPRIFSGIGNAYSDEILHRAGLSPMRQTHRLGDDETARLFTATREILSEWTDHLRDETGTRFPEKVTAFRKGMAVHGRYGEPCPVCGTEIQRVVFAENEMDYCPRCQTGGRLLADRARSRLLKGDWPKTIEELESP